MKQHSTPITRRQALQGIVATAATVGLARELAAQTPEAAKPAAGPAPTPATSKSPLHVYDSYA